MTHPATYCVIGVCADGTQEVCAARVSRQVADTVASTVRTMRPYVEVIVQKEAGDATDDPPPGSQSWQMKFQA